MVNSYYVAPTSTLIPGVPTLRRKTLTVQAWRPSIDDQEVAPGVENIQLQLGIDVDEDNTVDRYVNPGDEIYDPAAAGYVPGARVMTARIWLVVRGVTPEFGLQDNRNYQPGDVNMGHRTTVSVACRSRRRSCCVTPEPDSRDYDYETNTLLANKQQGAALVVGLMLLVVITVLAISGMNTATTELAMARNDQSYENAFQAAETGLEQRSRQGQFATRRPPQR